MIITTKRTSFGYGLDVLLTALGWLFFAMVFGFGIMAILRGEMRGPQTPLLTPLMLSSIHTVLGYLLVMVVFAAVLLSWAKYNQYRFQGVDRRRPPAPLSRQALQAISGMSEVEFELATVADVLVIEHDKQGRIMAVTRQDVRPDKQGEKTAALPRKSAERGLHRWGLRRKNALRNSASPAAFGNTETLQTARIQGACRNGSGETAWRPQWSAGVSRNTMGDYQLSTFTCRLYQGGSGG